MRPPWLLHILPELEPSDRRMDATDHFWDVATIRWPGGEIEQIDTMMDVAPNGGGRN